MRKIFTGCQHACKAFRQKRQQMRAQQLHGWVRMVEKMTMFEYQRARNRQGFGQLMGELCKQPWPAACWPRLAAHLLQRCCADTRMQPLGCSNQRNQKRCGVT